MKKSTLPTQLIINSYLGHLQFVNNTSILKLPSLSSLLSIIISTNGLDYNDLSLMLSLLKIIKELGHGRFSFQFYIYTPNTMIIQQPFYIYDEDNHCLNLERNTSGYIDGIICEIDIEYGHVFKAFSALSIELENYILNLPLDPVFDNDLDLESLCKEIVLVITKIDQD